MRLLLLIISISFLSTACSDGFKNITSQSNQGSSSPGEYDNSGKLSISIKNLEEDQLVDRPFLVTVEVSPIDELTDLRLHINGKSNHIFRREPFETQVDPEEHPGNIIILTVVSKDRQGLGNFKTLKLKKRDDTTNPPPAPGEYGTLDPNCFNSNNYDACLFLKSPVAQRNQAYSSVLSFGSDLSQDQIYGVNLKNLKNPDKLESASIRVYASGGINLSSSSDFKTHYKDDVGKNYVAQLMAYFWLTAQEETMIQKTGEFYTSQKSIPVDAYNEGVQNNAYWDSRQIVMGVVTNRTQRLHEMSMSGDILIHEMGHANFQHGIGRVVRDENVGTSSAYCRDANGCVGAINEGQADFHMLIMFPEKTALGETFVNNLRGISTGSVSRDVKELTSLTAQDIFSRTNGEIHGMGSAYTSILWEIYTHPQMNKNDFEVIFVKHIRKFSGSSRFIEAKQILLAEDSALFNGKYKAIIEGVFAAKGL